MKKIIIILCLLFITGCSAKYEIDFNKDNISENINVIINGNIYDIAKNTSGDGEYIEEELTQKYVPMLNTDNKYYEKEIELKNGKSYVNLKGKYTYNDLEHSYIINHCFNNIYINNTDKYLDVSLKDLMCDDSETLELIIKSDYTITNSNANNKKNNVYTWSLKTISTNGIEFRIIKEGQEKTGSFNNTISIILIVLFIISGSTIFILKKKEY